MPDSSTLTLGTTVIAPGGYWEGKSVGLTGIDLIEIEMEADGWTEVTVDEMIKASSRLEQEKWILQEGRSQMRVAAWGGELDVIQRINVRGPQPTRLTLRTRVRIDPNHIEDLRALRNFKTSELLKELERRGVLPDIAGELTQGGDDDVAGDQTLKEVQIPVNCRRGPRETDGGD